MKDIIIKITVAATFVLMVTLNSLANILPINGLTTGAISDSYPNLFAPAGITFSIWGLIYLLLAIYTVYQFTTKNKLIDKMNPYFIATSIANSLWIYSWHYRHIGVSVLLIIIILFSLIKIADLLNKEKFTLREKLCVRLPFSVYFGWLTVAVIANITTFIVSLNWNRFGFPDQMWAIIILLVGAAIGIIRTFKDRGVAYGLVLIWAYLGILIKHTSSTGFAAQYPAVILATLFCFIAFLTTEVLLVLKKQF